MRSTDGGNEWDSLINLEEAGHFGDRQDFSLFAGGMFVGWFDEDTSSATSYIAYSSSINGDIWSTPEYVSSHEIRMFDLGTAAFGDSIYAVYFSRQFDSTGGTRPLRFLYSSDMGATWSNEVTVGHLSEYTNFLHMAHCKNSLYIVWAGTPAPLGFYREVMAVVSHDGGQTWSDVMQLSCPDTAAAQYSCIACDEETGYFAVGWMDYGLSRNFPGDLFVRLTIDGGYNWLPESHVTTYHGVTMSQLAICGDSLWAVWANHDTAYGPICFSKSTDLGASWSPYVQITNSSDDSYAPWIAYDRGKLHVAWYNDNPPPDSGVDIYYKRFEPEVGIENEPDTNLSNMITLSAYPNPFNDATLISYWLDHTRPVNLTIYDILGRKVETLIDSEEEAGYHEVIWDAGEFSSGLYFYKITAGGYSNMKRMLLIK